jgi:hypothetical protein
MHRILPALSFALLAACAGTAPSRSDGATPSAAAAPQRSSGTFHITRGADTIARERFTRTAARLDADMRVPSVGARLAYVLDVAPDASVTRVDLRAFAPGADSTPAQRVVATMGSDSVTAEITAGAAAPRTTRAATTRGAVLYINPSPSAVEQIIRRARVLGGDSVQVPVLAIESLQTGPATVRFLGADSATVSLGNVVFRTQVDRAGALLGGSVPSQNLVITRTP